VDFLLESWIFRGGCLLLAERRCVCRLRGLRVASFIIISSSFYGCCRRGCVCCKVSLSSVVLEVLGGSVWGLWARNSGNDTGGVRGPTGYYSVLWCY
jgi:hypothetical protein